ncbi:MAG TPA: carboxypeptidase-like regulatory domain-containing protein [Gemmatimonadaceae bacterium]|nr:carboxypeptidase-like regulatory domain-containing protein [Gemmatimonadaceae bacterium]
MLRFLERAMFLASAWLCAAMGIGGAQRAPASRSSDSIAIVGVASDSIRGAPLAGAFITLAAAGKGTRSTMSDDRGRFHFDRVLPGEYVVAMQHARLDTLGLSGASRRIQVTDGRDTILLSTPSFDRLWRFECDGEPPTADSGFVFGTVRSATTRRPLAGATVTVRWTSVEADKAHGVAEHEWRADAVSDSTGDFRVCDVPSSELFQVSGAGPASAAAVASGQFSLIPNGNRIRRVDLVLGGRSTGASAGHGVVIGVVTVPPGKPVAGALVTMDDSIEARTDSSGVFVMRDAPDGTHQLEARFVGMAPTDALADVYPGDTTRVAMAMSTVTTLSTVNVKAARSVWQMNVAAFEHRRTLGIGHFRDSTTLAKHPTLQSVLQELADVESKQVAFARGIAVTFPDVKGDGKRCTPSVWIDGKLSDMDRTIDIGTEDMAAVEVYTRVMSMPPEFLDHRNHNLCGAIVIWTKRAFP